MWQTIKDLLNDDTFFYTLMVVLVGAISFGLGQCSGELMATTSSEQTAAVMTPVRDVAGRAATPPASTTKPTTSTTVVASKNGSKYHLSDCPGAKQINDENLLSFDSIAIARAAGYTPAANCPGLE